ncbi:regulator [Streptomyces lasiicapitis]|uniref:regulator n=1 Tax=Streptomyces lasiicapitis TaxID=1923961 RepID=UPI001666D01F|nr:regulator [Streptomyces lasiicapitis]
MAAFITEAEFTHAGLARRIDQLGQEHGLDLRYDETSVTRWLRGQQPRGSTPALIAEVFARRLGRRVSATDLGLDPITVYAGLEYATTQQEAVDIVSCLWRRDSGDLVELRKVAFTPSGLVVPARDWIIGRADERVAQDPHTQPRAWYGGKGPTQVLPGDISALRSVSDLFRTLDEAYGGGHARQALITYLAHQLEPLLRGTYDEETGRRLFAAASDLTRLAGWTSYDIAAHGIAQRYFVQALRLAQAAGDRAYGAYVLVTMSQQAVYLGHGREAVQLARVAQQGVGTNVPPIVQTLLYAAEARGHALLGEVRACTASLTHADRAFATARPGDEIPRWARFFDEAQLLDDFAHCHRDLLQFRAAAGHAERSLQLRAPAYARSSLLCKVVLATARLGLGELDQACQLAAEAAGQTAGMRSIRVIEYIKDFERRLEPFRGTADVRAYYRRASAG